ncbi:MAG: hypothetical protein IJ240_09765 [Clostridia bacterium]|nr:hypothetical protein [Clostridia bacterium]
MLKKLFGGLFSLIGLILSLSLLILLCVLLVKPSAERQSSARVAVSEIERPSYLQATDSRDIGILSRLFEHPLPYDQSGSVQGTVETVFFEGENTRLATLRYDRYIIRCVTPASSAPLLLDKRLVITPIQTAEGLQTSLTVLSMPAFYATNGRLRCLYFSDSSASYSITTDSMDFSDFLNAAFRLGWVG